MAKEKFSVGTFLVGVRGARCTNNDGVRAARAIMGVRVAQAMMGVRAARAINGSNGSNENNGSASRTSDDGSASRMGDDESASYTGNDGSNGNNGRNGNNGSNSIFDELVDIENQKKEALFGLSIAQIAGLIIVDHANEVQIHRLIEEIKKWTVAYQLDDFLYLLKKHKITNANQGLN